MPAFTETLQQIAAWRRDTAAKELAIHQARERLRRLEARRAALARSFDPRNDAHRAQRRELDAQVAEISATIDRAQRELLGLRDRGMDLVGAFEDFADPRRSLTQLDATLPILLFPVRLETRFTSVSNDAGSVNELWVRIYPDDCLIDTFEPTPSESEARNLRRFWIEWAKAGGVRDQQRTAWRGLVGRFNSGRAAWLQGLAAYRPVAPAPLPTKAEPQDMLLVIPIETAVLAAERSALAAYWKAVWLGADDRTAQNQAFAALESAVGGARAAALVAAFQPANLADQPLPPFERNAVQVDVVFLEFQPLDEHPTQQLTWSQAPAARLLPERFVLLGFRNGTNVLNQIGHPIPSSLAVGPNPSAPDSEQLRQEDGELVIPDDMRWMVDFDTAVQVGMGFRVRLSADDQARGFDQLMVLGVRLSSDASEAKAELETLIQHHQNGSAGFSLLRTGTATNNTESDGAGFSESEPADASFDVLVGAPEPIVAASDPAMRLDGQWFADTLGIDLSVLERTVHSRGRDQREARAMNTALWPGTLGYAMESLMRPVFDEDAVSLTRWFFTHYVTGRGTAPAVRVGQQPYAILPATRFGAMTWLDSDAWRPPTSVVHPSGARPFLRRLARLLAVLREDWTQMAGGVAYVAKSGGDPHQRLLDILGLNPASIDFYQRYAESLEDISNRLRLAGFGERIQTAIQLLALGDGRELLARLGYTGSAIPELLEKYFLDTPDHLDGPIIDDVLPLSESAPIRAYAADHRNYLQWLMDAAATSFETLRRQDGFIDDTPPRALLYLLLRYALQQGYWDAGLRLHLESGVLTQAQAAVARIDPSFIHVAPSPGIPRDAAVTVGAPGAGNGAQVKPVFFEAASESRYHYLYAREPRITQSQESIAEFIPRMIGRVAATRFLDDQLTALRLLTDTPTARLERLLAEHLDLCTYRLDAWRAGLLHYQLGVIRESSGSEEPRTRQGIYLGAFGWLENVKAEPRRLTPATLPANLSAGFVSGNGAPPMQDSTNQGYIHAPSLNQAIAAAILRNGYISNALPAEPNTLAVNLSSARVRRALGMIEGLRSGQSLGALLGYRLERALHDQHPFAEVDEFIYELRRAFPLVANQMTETQAPANEPIESIEAQNVVDGLALVEHMRRSGSTAYPFGKPLKPVASPAQATAINAAVDQLLELHDAVADLAMAESVYQAVLGNYERTGATLDAYSQGGFPPEPEVIQTPRSGTTLTHRVALHLRSGLDGSVSPNALPVTPRVRSEPALNAWLDTHLPNAASVACRATYVDPVNGTDVVVDLTQADLQLQPLDLLYLINPDTDRAMSTLDDLVRDFVIDQAGLRPDVRIEIAYLHRYADRYSFFEVGALLSALRRLVLRSRPLKASDMVLAGEATRKHDHQNASLAADRLVEPLATLTAIVQNPAADDLSDLAADMDAPLADPVLHRAAIVSNAEAWAVRYIGLARRAMAFGIAQSGIGAVYDQRSAAYAAGLETLDAALIRWQTRLDDFDAAIAELAGLPSDAERFDHLRAAERLVTTVFTVPQPATPAAYQALLATKRTASENKRALFVGIRSAPPASGHALIGAIDAALQAAPPIDQFDHQGVDLTAHRDALVQLAFAVQAHVAGLSKEIITRRDTCQSLLSDADTAGPGDESVRLRTEAAKALFGQDFVIVPEFSLPAQAGDELGNAWNDRATLLQYLAADPPAGRGTDFPVDDWLYGIARVREKMQLWEQITLAAEMVQTAAPELAPLQLPFRPDDRWLGLDHPDGYDYEGERLLYTAHFTQPFDKTRPQCGLLLDEWTEVIPAKEETTGLAFHYDRPSTEPPQAWLLALSPAMIGGWQWEDLVASVRDTFDEARLRAVEPTQIDRTKYARFLPAVIMAATRHPITIGLNLAENNGLAAFVTESDNA